MRDGHNSRPVSPPARRCCCAAAANDERPVRSNPPLAQLLKEKEEAQTASDRCSALVIRQEGRAKRSWDALIFALAVFSAVMTPLQVRVRCLGSGQA